MTTVDFPAWQRAITATLVDGADADVPCGACTACCASHQFVAIGPGEPALAAVPKKLRFPAPYRPGWWILPHDEAGRCAMFQGGRCAIYAQRPQVCRAFDCRAIGAAGLRVPDAPGLDAAAAAWSFEGGEAALAALRRIAAAVAAHPDAPPRPHQVAAVALRVLAAAGEDAGEAAIAAALR